MGFNEHAVNEPNSFLYPLGLNSYYEFYTNSSFLTLVFLSVIKYSLLG